VEFLKEDFEVTGVFFEESPLAIEFPESVDMRVVTSPPPIHDQDSSNYKSVTLENGRNILVPPFIKQGDLIRVNVETGKYMERV
jgi:elongation factor P